MLVSCPFLIFDWGDTIMRDDPAPTSAMYLWPAVEVMEGAEEVLRRLRPGRTIALATGAARSSEADIWRALARGNLDPFFDKVYCFGNTGCRKPAPQFYEYVLRDLGARPSEALMVGDSWENDVLGANRVGIRAVWLNEKNGETRHGALYQTVRSLHALLDLLAA